MAGKLSRRRNALITLEQEDLRWELIKATPKRKVEIKLLLQVMKIESKR